jgi:hypothetical protein
MFQTEIFLFQNLTVWYKQKFICVLRHNTNLRIIKANPYTMQVTIHEIKIKKITQIAALATASTAVLQEDHQDRIIPEYLSISVSYGPVQYKRVFGMTGITLVISSNITFIIDQTFFERKLALK